MKTYIPAISTILFTTLISIGISYAAWNTPTATPPADAIATPITAISPAQVKPAGLSVNTFAALGNASFKQRVLANGMLVSIDPTTPVQIFRIGGVNAAGTTIDVDTTISHDLISGDTLGSSYLKNTTLNPLCGDSTGTVVLCN